MELGSHLKALNLIDQLHRQQQYNQTLTDLSFMAGIAISSNALQQMRSTEVRALNETTYPQAKLLAENIQFAKPALAPVEFKSHTVSNYNLNGLLFFFFIKKKKKLLFLIFSLFLRGEKTERGRKLKFSVDKNTCRNGR